LLLNRSNDSHVCDEEAAQLVVSANECSSTELRAELQMLRVLCRKVRHEPPQSLAAQI